MPVAIGTRLGPYEILAPIGAGGMGEVYRARDTKLKRDVALKILPDAYARDPERMARFQREAEVLASLNHPNIAHIYGVEERALVMELVEGESPKGPLPFEDAWKIALQMADALEYAHDRGVIQRDLKPANVKVTPDGVAKLLDFGLAKAFSETPDAASSDPENSPTVTLGATVAGTILGTAAYMSPEQAKGKRVDKRADIWSWGVVLYELLTGERLFKGVDTADTLAQVLTKEPDLNRTPAQVRKLLGRCLEKDPKKRLRDIGDAWELLDQEPVVTPPAAAGPSHRWLWAAVAGLLVLAAIGWLRSGSHDTQNATITLSIVPPVDKRLPFVGDLAAAPLISPDGSSVLYAAGGAGSVGLYVRRLDSLSPTLVPGSEKASNLACWSADSASIIYPTRSALMRVRLPDGAPEMMGPPPGITRGCSASADGAILTAAANQLLLLTAPRGEFQKLNLPGLGKPMYPEFLPNGKDFLFSVLASGVYLASLEAGKIVNPVRLTENAHQASYTPAGGGSILFVRDDKLYAQSLNLRQRKLAGESRLIQEGIGSIANESDNSADFSVSRSGTIVWRPGRAASAQVTTVDRAGKVIGTSGPSIVAYNLSLSPDGTRLLASGGGSTLLLNVGRPGSQAFEGNWFGWFPDGSEIFGTDGGKIKKRSLTGGEAVDLGSPTQVIFGRVPRDLSPDGTQLLYVGGANGEGGLLAWPLGGSAENREARLLVPNGATFINYARFSPDGRWIVYVQDGLYVQPFPGPGLRRQIGPNGSNPVWRGDGREILELGRDGIMSIPVSWARGEPHFGTPSVLFLPKGMRPPPGSFAAAIQWAVSRDGSQLYWLQGEEQPGSGVIDLRTNAVK